MHRIKVSLLLTIFFISFVSYHTINKINDEGTTRGKVIDGEKNEHEIPIKWWNYAIPVNDFLNIKSLTGLRINDAEMGTGSFKSKSLQERKLAINRYKKDLKIYETKKWNLFLNQIKEGDRIYFFSSKPKEWGMGSGYIIVRSTKIIAVFSLSSE